MLEHAPARRITREKRLFIGARSLRVEVAGGQGERGHNGDARHKSADLIPQTQPPALQTERFGQLNRHAARTALGRARQIDEARLPGLEKAPEIARVRISLATTLHALGDTEAALAELDAAERGLAGSATSALVEDRRLQLSIERLRRKLRGP